MEYMPNRLTPLYSKIYYKEENYLKVKTTLFKYITPPYSKGVYVRYIRYIKYITLFTLFALFTPFIPCLQIMWLSYPSSYSSTDFNSPASHILILNCFRSHLNIYIILFIKSVTPTPSSNSSSLKISSISKSSI